MKRSIFLGLVLVAVTQWLGGLLLHLPRIGDTAEWLLALPIPLLLVTLTFAVLFMSLPPVRLAWRHVWLAAVICGAAWTITAELLVMYGVFFGASLGGYGAIGGIIGHETFAGLPMPDKGWDDEQPAASA